MREKEIPANGTPRRTQGGIATSDVTRSASVAGNADVFPEILALHLPEGGVIADVTFGRGVFWTNVDRRRWRVLGSDLLIEDKIRDRFPALDLKSDVDFANLPYDDASLDGVVLDPPYMEGFYRQNAQALAGSGTHSNFRSAYSAGAEGSRIDRPHDRFAWQDRVIEAYLAGATEAHRVLREGGLFFVKCQDAVSANVQRLAHVEIITGLEELGFYCKDLFVVVRPARPGVSRLKTQVHARKNHSYFLVFVKRKPFGLRSCRSCRAPDGLVRDEPPEGIEL